MKTYKKVYVVHSTMQTNFLVFGSEKRAKEWIKNFNKEIFKKSEKEDLYISKRVIF